MPAMVTERKRVIGAPLRFPCRFDRASHDLLAVRWGISGVIASLARVWYARAAHNVESARTARWNSCSDGASLKYENQQWGIIALG
jgi:hypothetical protein